MKQKRILPQIRQRQPCQPAGEFGTTVSPLLQRIYLNRGITQPEQLQKDLSRLPLPEQLKGMDQAVALLAEALSSAHRITVIGDFDADGATSTALAIHALRDMGATADFLVPNRFEYGYGLTPEIVEEAIRLQQPDVIITVDNGISSWAGVALARSRGVRVLVTDHHLPGKTLPDADAIVNPNQPGCTFPSKNIAGVGVIFYVMSALRKQLRADNYFTNNNIAEPNMADYLDLVALGTVADVVSLDQVNRTLVHQGLLRIRSGRTRPGIIALADVAKRSLSRLTSSDLGFAIAPRLNAAGRMDDMSTGIQCLLNPHLNQARYLASELDNLNRNRKSVEQGMQQEALKVVEQLHLDENGLPRGLCVFDESWHQGVVGLLASRLKERYHRPVIAFAPADMSNSSEDMLLKGSARSIEGLHIRDALDAIATQHPELIDKFGGHAMAAGLSLQRKHLPAFAAAFDAQVRGLLDESALLSVLQTDGTLNESEFMLPLAKQLRDSEPWGQHFPAPLFEGNFQVLYKRAVGEQHIRLVLRPVVSVGATHELPLRASNLQIDAMMFFIDDELKSQIVEGSTVHAAYRLDVNEYQGEENVQLTIEYLENTL
jgi:single-stranded-DNA-specific exonuclease